MEQSLEQGRFPSALKTTKSVEFGGPLTLSFSYVICDIRKFSKRKGVAMKTATHNTIAAASNAKNVKNISPCAPCLPFCGLGNGKGMADRLVECGISLLQTAQAEQMAQADSLARS